MYSGHSEADNGVPLRNLHTNRRFLVALLCSQNEPLSSTINKKALPWQNWMTTYNESRTNCLGYLQRSVDWNSFLISMNKPQSLLLCSIIFCHKMFCPKVKLISCYLVIHNSRSNRPFAASHSRGTKLPRWRAKVALGQDKQKTYI